MDRNIVNVNDNFVTAELENNVCPLNWLAEFYKEKNLKGKLVVLDNALMDYLLNKSHANTIEVSKSDGHVQFFSLHWDADEKLGYPETNVKLSCYGGKEIRKVGNKYDFSKSYDDDFIIEKLQAEDILVNGIKYASDAGDYTLKGPTKIKLNMEQAQKLMEKYKGRGDEEPCM